MPQIGSLAQKIRSANFVGVTLSGCRPVADVTLQAWGAPELDRTVSQFQAEQILSKRTTT
jgi:hypothetical protein